MLPFNPQGLAAVAPDLAFNTAASFTTNTNWQSYVGETTMSYFTQMAGLAYHNFVSAAVGIALAIAFIRGIAAREKDTLGNFWVDMTRATLWVLLPFCIVGALLLVSQGVVQNLKPYDRVQLVDPQTTTATDDTGKQTSTTISEQVIAQGPVASQEFIKEWGTNGGGFFNANSAHPYENPTPFTNFIEMFAIFAISAGLTYTLGHMTRSPRHGWAVWAAMAFLFLAGVSTAYWAEAAGNPLLAGTDQQAGAMCPGGNMEGKESRFGIANSALFATITTAASCGAVNSMHDSFTPLGGLVPMVNMMLGEVIFGGVGAGMYGILIMVVLAVFIAGLMVGRTPEYLGKKIEAFDVQMAMLADPGVPAHHPGVHRHCRGLARLRDVEHLEPRPARAVGDALRLHVGHGQQRLGLRRHLRQHQVVQHHARHRDADRPLHDHHSDAGAGRQPRPQEAGAALAGHVPGDDAAVHRAARGRDRDRRRADFLPRAEPGPDRRALPHARRRDVLK